MRIGITCYPTYGGSGAVATELGLELGRRGHEVHLFHSRIFGAGMNTNIVAASLEAVVSAANRILAAA